MLEPDNPNDTTNTSTGTPREPAATPPAEAPRKRASSRASARPAADPTDPALDAAPARPARKQAAAKAGAAKTAAKAPAKAAAKAPAKAAAKPPAKAAAKPPAKAAAKRRPKAAPEPPAEAAAAATTDAGPAPATDEAPVKATRKRSPRKTTAAGRARADAPPAEEAPDLAAGGQPQAEAPPAEPAAAPVLAPLVVFQPPAGAAPAGAAPTAAKSRRRRATDSTGAAPEPPAKRAGRADRTDGAGREPTPATAELTVAADAEDHVAEPEDVREAAVEEATGARRRRRRGRRGRGGHARAAEAAEATTADAVAAAEAAEDAGPAEVADQEPADQTAGDQAIGDEEAAEPSTRRRRRRKRSSSGAEVATDDDPPNTVVHVRPARKVADGADRAAEGTDGVRAVKGSTRLEAKRQRRRDGRDSGRRRPPILSEAEFLARREAVDRVMAVRQLGDRTQIAVLEDDVLVEHYVTRASATSYVGNIYLGRVQNVLPSMEAAFVDIGKGRNGVLYAGEVNWDAAGLEGKSRAIENALKSGDTVLVQVTKDPIGHKGARLTSQISLPGRFLVLVPGGGMTGISRKLPDTERHRLKSILKKIVPEDAGVIIRTAAEGASEEELTRDVERLTAQWQKISKKAERSSSAPTLVHGEPDLAIRVVRDVFNEDFKRLLVQGEQAWHTVSDYVHGVAPDLAERVSRHTAETDLFHELRVDEQLMKALDRKVWLPSGGSLVIDRTEAMTVIDVNTGKFVGAGGNLEQTVTRNNLEAAEEIVRQLRLRDVGGIVVIDFIDMVLESNRELVLRRLTECLGRDRTKHQVAEVTSLGLVQMTRKRVGEGLLEAFSETCEVCHGRGVIVHADPVETSAGRGSGDEDRPKARRRRAKKAEDAEPEAPMSDEQRQQAMVAIAAIHRAANPADEPAGGDSDADAAAELEMEAAATVLEDVPTEAEPRPDGAGQSGPDGAASEPEIIPAEPDVAPESEADAAPALITAPPRRRRRAASRPAGPPTSG